MKTRPLASTNINLSVIGLGTWAIGGNNWKYGWGAQDDQESIRCIHAALDNGINWIDTAPAYGLGHCEEIVGKALKQRKTKAIIATKCGLFQDKKGDMFSRLKSESIKKEVEDSLRRLQIEVIDIYQIHWPNPSGDIEEGFSCLLELVKAGKIRCASVCNFSLEQLEKISKISMPVSLQSPYSIVNRDLEKSVIPWCQKNKISFLAYSPLQSGLLTGKITKKWIEELPQDDWRKEKSKDFREPRLSQILDFVESCKDKLKGKTANPAIAACLQWLVARPGITSAIVGMRNELQLTQIIQALDTEIPGDLLEEMSKSNAFS